MNSRAYKAYLRSAHWQDVRRRYWQSKLPKSCYCCGRKSDLQLHHRTYKRLGAERLTDLVPLCDTCHRQVHLLVKQYGSGKLTLWTAAQKWKLHRTPGRKGTRPYDLWAFVAT